MAAPAIDLALVRSWVAEAHARWPGVTLDAHAFAAHLTALGHGVPAFPADAYLAAACAAGDAAALRVLEDEVVTRVPSVLRRVDPSPAFTEEACQLLRVRLLVADDDQPPRIARFTGEVPLSAWVRVIAIRVALNAKRGGNPADPGHDAIEDATRALDDPELDYLRTRYREPFETAFQEVLTALTKDDRTILRLHYVDGLNIDGIGRIYQVHRATVARWLARIRADVLARAKTLLAERLGADADEVASVIGALAGEIDVTLSRVLGRASAIG